MSRRSRMLRPLAVACLAAFVAPAAGCEENPGTTTGALSCTPDPALIAEHRACRGDDDCPCGAGCVLGECVAACSADADCAGGWCDQFGRCRAAADRSRIAGLAPVASGNLGLSSSVLRIADPSEPRPLRITPNQGVAAGPVRVTVDEALELRCSEDGPFEPECRFDELPPDGEQVVWVRPRAPLPDGATPQVRVFWADQIDTVSVTQELEGGRPPVDNDVLLAGQFVGQALLQSAGVGDDPTTPGTLLADLALPVTAQLFLGGTGSGTLVLDERLKVLHPNGQWVGRVATSAPDAGTVDFPTVVYLEGEASEGAPVEVLMEAPVATLQVGGNAFSFELVTRFTGLLMGGRAPQARWRVSLTRTGDLPSGARAPAVPGDATPRLDVLRAQSATPWEAALSRTAMPAPDSVLTLPPAEKRALLAVWGGRSAGEGTLQVCGLTTTVVDALAQFGLRDTWGAEFSTDTTRRPPTELTSSGLPIVSRLASELSDKPAIWVSSVLRPTTTARVLPCSATFTAVPATFTASGCTDQSVTFNLLDIDLCDRMAAAYGCEVVASTGETLTVEARATYEQGTCVYSNLNIPLVGTVDRVCRLPVVPAACAEMALCYEPPATGGSTAASVEAPYFAAGAPLPVSGDLRCAAGDRTAAIELDVNAELPVTDETRLNAQQSLAACAADMAQLRDETAPSALRPYGEGLREVLTGGHCMQAPRFYWALGLATDPDRRRALDRNAAASPLSSAVANRLLQRWLHAHGFIAREAAETERMAQVFRGSGLPGDPVLPVVEEVLADSLAGWDLLLHPRFATALERLPDPVLVAPDYRPLATGSPVAGQPHHEQPTTVGVTMLETLGAQLALVEPRLEQAALSRDLTAVQTLSRVLRYVVVLRPLALELAARAATYAAANGLPEPVWQDRWDALLRTMGGAFGRQLTYAEAILDGANPLGIEDEDLPLYFFGTEESAAARFSAISDYLVGYDSSSLAWAPVMVTRATAALDTARASWTARRDRDVAVAQSTAERDGKLDEIRTTYGEQLAALCGTPPGLATINLIENWEPFDESRCFVRQDNPICEYAADEYAALLTAAQVKYHMCVVRTLRNNVGYMVGFLDESLNELMELLPDCPDAAYPVDCGDGHRRCLRCVAPRETRLAEVTPDTFRRVGGVNAVGLRSIEDAINACRRQFPGVDPHLPGPDDIPNSPASRVECYSGSMGEAVFEIRAAAQDLEIARSQLAELQARYDIAMASCLIQQVGNDQLEAAQAEHNETMGDFRDAKLAADEVAKAAQATKDCASAGDAMAVECGAAIAQAAAEGLSDGMQYAMDEAKQAHDSLMATIQHQISEDRCFNDAEMHLVGAGTATLQIARAMTDLDAARYRLEQFKIAARCVYDDGRAALVAAQGRHVPPLSHDLWLDENIDEFLRVMRIARRIMYLAVKAVEYETQQSLALSGTILAATHPNRLQAALEELWESAGTRGVAGSRPADFKVVLSLRDQLLQLADQTYLPDGEQRLTDIERFRLLIQSPRFSVFDDAGAYLGQQIPFEIAPLGAIRLGQAEGIPVLSATDCAERLWSVNASILGGDGLYRGNAPPTYTRIDLLKSNTFYSQWCAPHDGTFQTSSVRPSRNLFRDPVFGGEYGTGLGPRSEAQLMTRARIEAYFNVDRETFESDDYANGDTSELAARGLFGKYALFIPADVLALGGGEGLVLNEVDDVLLRLDYVSVAR